MIERRRMLLGSLGLCALAACSGGINAGEKGGQAFIAFAAMLLITLAILWIVLGRER